MLNKTCRYQVMYAINMAKRDYKGILNLNDLC